jgi:ribosomal protein S18 acetylase RimI-like enzyme
MAGRMAGFEPASRFSLADLAEVWRKAYEGYVVPLAFDADELRRHIRASQIDLSLSVVLVVDGEPAGLSFVARDGDEAWIGGFGIAEAFRRCGHGLRLMRAHAERLDAAGIARTRLEVIDGNPAEEVYRRSGFARERELVVLEGRVDVDGVPGVELSRGELARAHARLHREEPSWRRGLARVIGALAEHAPARVVGVKRDGRVSAFAAILNLDDRFGLFDAAAEDVDGARALLRALAAERSCAWIRLVDEPLGTPMSEALEGEGFERSFRQWEMVRSRKPC